MAYEVDMVDKLRLQDKDISSQKKNHPRGSETETAVRANELHQKGYRKACIVQCGSES